MTILYILLFIVFLGLLIMIHELGHLVTAKMFKVYCFEYAIGFGPKIFSKKRKGGETVFSLRAIPFGGFVSMYGEDESIPEGTNVDPSRSLNNIKKWKKAIIMSAGVIMNMVLAIVMFFIFEVAFPKNVIYTYQVRVNSGSTAYEAGLRTGDEVFSMYTSTTNSSLILYDNNALIQYEDSALNERIYFGVDYSSINLSDTEISTRAVAYAYNKIGDESSLAGTEISIEDIVNDNYDPSITYKVKGYSLAAMSVKENALGTLSFKIIQDFRGNTANSLRVELPIETAHSAYNIPRYQEVTVVGQIVKDDKGYVISTNADDYALASIDISKNFLTTKKDGNAPTKINFNMYKINETHPSGEAVEFNDVNVKASGDRFVLKTDKGLGLNINLGTFRISYSESVKNTFKDFADSATLIGRGIGSLFSSSDAWKDIGGIVAIGFTTTQTLKNNGFGQYLYFWAMISVNLAIVNLLPFPGLDGWHLLVTIVEGVSRKEIPNKFKTWASAVGLILLFTLMILIVVKDVINFI